LKKYYYFLVAIKPRMTIRKYKAAQFPIAHRKEANQTKEKGVSRPIRKIAIVASSGKSKPIPKGLGDLITFPLTQIVWTMCLPEKGRATLFSVKLATRRPKFCPLYPSSILSSSSRLDSPVNPVRPFL